MRQLNIYRFGPDYSSARYPTRGKLYGSVQIDGEELYMLALLATHTLGQAISDNKNIKEFTCWFKHASRLFLL
ncbi:hypothetical protein EG68_01216 [Paragonimus skrjabini miyazakii]|uniref:Uncharacterized protein n=1 Tax=Paragonimus skrjabini miyazakii TaxID=59628 RepID=A0A8S9ZC70_9TREM|nr:hypothetical protein EG68_01216 [Paragonimus skrjabini miyazakii]